MWPAGDDLPLISGCPMTIKIQPFNPTSASRQLQLIEPNCRLCNDTGNVRGKRCWCNNGKDNHESLQDSVPVP